MRREEEEAKANEETHLGLAAAANRLDLHARNEVHLAERAQLGLAVARRRRRRLDRLDLVLVDEKLPAAAHEALAVGDLAHMALAEAALEAVRAPAERQVERARVSRLGRRQVVGRGRERALHVALARREERGEVVVVVAIRAVARSALADDVAETDVVRAGAVVELAALRAHFWVRHILERLEDETARWRAHLVLALAPLAPARLVALALALAGRLLGVELGLLLGLPLLLLPLPCRRLLLGAAQAHLLLLGLALAALGRSGARRGGCAALSGRSGGGSVGRDVGRGGRSRLSGCRRRGRDVVGRADERLVQLRLAAALGGVVADGRRRSRGVLAHLVPLDKSARSHEVVVSSQDEVESLQRDEAAKDGGRRATHSGLIGAIPPFSVSQ